MGTQETALIKGYIKNLPIWDDLESLKEKTNQLTATVDDIIKRQNNMFAEIEELPRFNLETRLDIFEVIENPKSKDTTKFFRKIDGHYEVSNPDVVDLTRDNKQIRSESLKLLSSRVQQGESVYAMIDPKKPWVKCSVIVVYQRRAAQNKDGFTTVFRLKVSSDDRIIQVNKFMVARIQHHWNTLEPPKRIIAGKTEDTMYPGTLAFNPFDENKFRYMVIMDDGSTSYFTHDQIYPIVGQSKCPWVDARLIGTGTKFNEYYHRDYLLRYPTRSLLQINPQDFGTIFELYRNGKLVRATKISSDCDIIRVQYEDKCYETIFRGSLRIRTWDHKKLITCPIPDLDNDKIHHKLFWQLTLNCKAYHETGCQATCEDIYGFAEDLGNIVVSKGGQLEESGDSPKRITVELDKDDPLHKDLDDQSSCSSSSHGTVHQCNSDCLKARGDRNESTISDIIDEFRTVCDLRVPLLLGWKHEVRETAARGRPKRVTIYEAPCGKEFKTLYAIKRYLMRTGSKLDIDYFTDETEIQIHKRNPPLDAYYFNPNMAEDVNSKEPLENKFVSALNQYSEEELAFDFIYANKAFMHPRLERLGLTMNLEFKSGCDCEDDCQRYQNCSCHKLTEQAYESENSLSDTKLRYNYKRLPAILRTGIFECNSLCKCSSKCGNRVVQNGIRFRFQVKKTLNKGWGLITLDDIPVGSFVCTYAAEILDDADKYGNDDMYFADMDYITVNEANKLLTDEEESGVGSNLEDEDSDIEIIEVIKKDTPKPSTSKDKCDISPKTKPANQSVKRNVAIKSLSAKRMRKSTRTENKNKEKAESNRKNKFKRIHDLLGTHDFTLDARMSGNIGRFCNHSCEPNCSIQNVFIDTHDLRFPVPSLFANRNIIASEEITWDYGYQMGSIPGREIICNCGAKACKGRIL